MEAPWQGRAARGESSLRNIESHRLALETARARTTQRSKAQRTLAPGVRRRALCRVLGVGRKAAEPGAADLSRPIFLSRPRGIAAPGTSSCGPDQAASAAVVVSWVTGFMI